MERAGHVPYNDMMFRLAHISDLHLGPLPAVAYRELASKRIVGYVNWHRNRRRLMHEGVLGPILDGIASSDVDHLAITGDLVNLALDSEVEAARRWLEALGDPHEISVVPGNHDAYVPGALDRVCRSWGPWMTGDGDSAPVGRRDFPYLRVRGKVALIGISTARATAPFMANGFFEDDQAGRTAQLLDRAAADGLYRVVMIHHPPVRGAVPQHKRLFGIGRFQRMVLRHGAELVLHGHSHLPTLFWIAGRKGPLPVVGVAAGAQGLGGHNPPAQFNLLEIDGEPGHWTTRLTRQGYAGDGKPLELIETVELRNERP